MKPRPEDGSSPLTRGKPRRLPRDRRGVGLIPAHAGKTSKRVHWGRHPGAHPRSRGENDIAGEFAANFGGSSPLTRGKREGDTLSHQIQGLIPAHAGKTPRPKRPCARAPAHPRSRGENSVRVSTGVWGRGSSPLTRGKPRMRYRATPDRGLIPAHAGKTSPSRIPPCSHTAHPRSRGENDGVGLPLPL